MKKLKLAIFDMDGVLIDSERFALQSAAQACEELGLPFDEIAFRANMGGKTDGGSAARQLGTDAVHIQETERMLAAIGHAINNTLHHLYVEGMPLKAGVIEVLDFFEQNEVKCCVASSSSRDRVLAALTSAGIVDRFAFLICGEDTKRGKPEPDIFLYACRKAEVELEDAIVFEDSNNGGMAAKNGGIPYIIIPDVAIVSDEVLGHAACVANSLADVPSIVRSMYGECAGKNIKLSS